jgi:hypothetical protein
MKQELDDGNETKTSTIQHKCFNNAIHFAHNNHCKPQVLMECNVQ